MDDFWIGLSIGLFISVILFLAGFHFGKSKRIEKVDNNDFGGAIIYSWALVGCIAFFTSYPVFKFIDLMHNIFK